MDAGGEGGGVGAPAAYALRHTFASWSIAAGIGLFELSPDSLDRARVTLEAFGSEARAAFGP